VTEGLVRIQVIESVFSGVEIETKLTDKRITEDRLRNTVAAQIQPGDPMSLKKLERGLMLANDIPGVNVSGRLVAGAADLTTGGANRRVNNSFRSCRFDSWPQAEVASPSSIQTHP
jgi:hemolysin activation/secretion protein